MANVFERQDVRKVSALAAAEPQRPGLQQPAKRYPMNTQVPARKAERTAATQPTPQAPRNEGVSPFNVRFSDLQRAPGRPTPPAPQAPASAAAAPSAPRRAAPPAPERPRADFSGLASAFDRQDVRRVNLMGGEPQRPGLQQPANRYPTNTQVPGRPAAPAPAQAPAGDGFSLSALAAPFQRQDVRRVELLGGAEPQRPGLQQPARRYPMNTQVPATAAAAAPALDQTPSGRASLIPNERGADSIDPRVRASFAPATQTAPAQTPAAQPAGPRRDWSQGALTGAAAADLYRDVWQANPSASRGLRGANNDTLGVYNAEQQARGTGISVTRDANGRLAFTGNGANAQPQAYTQGVDLNASNASLARANAIRAGNSALQDQLTFNAGGASFRQKSQDEIVRDMLTSASRTDREAALRYLGTGEVEGMRNESALAQERLRGQNRLDEANLTGQWGVAQQGLVNAGAYDRTQVTSAQRGSAALQGGVFKVLDALIKSGDVEGAERFRQEVLAEMNARRGADEVPAFAEGGLVSAYGQTPQAPQVLPEINEYRDYAVGAQRLGLPAIPFQQFLTLRQGAQHVAGAQGVQPYGAMGFAEGGEIPDMGAMQMIGHDPHAAGGKMVVDADPNAPTDSIPAMIDGQHPAKLDSGEFVIPTDVVKFFGTDKLNKMIAQARAGQNPQE